MAEIAEEVGMNEQVNSPERGGRGGAWGSSTGAHARKVWGWSYQCAFWRGEWGVLNKGTL